MGQPPGAPCHAGSREQPGLAPVLGLPANSLSRAIVLPPVPRAARASRRWVGQTLARWRLTAVAATAEHLVSELVTNSLEHAENCDSVVVLLMYAAGVLRLEVRDHDPGNIPEIKTPDPTDSAGRGLVIVAALSDRWGVRMAGCGKSVWCELAASPPSARGELAHGGGADRA